MSAFSWSTSEPRSSLQKAVDEHLADLSPAEARTAQYLLHHEGEIAFETGASIARKAGVSEITVSRVLRRMGFQGVPGLKAALQKDVTAGQLGAEGPAAGLFSGDYGAALHREAHSLLALSEQVQSPVWGGIVAEVAGADQVYATGFQTVRGASEDFARRLSLVRSDVRFLAAHDSSLAEWIGLTSDRSSVLVLIDVIPYAREAPAVAQLCRDHGIGLVVFTDEFNTWAREHTDKVFHVHTESGLFLESTGIITTALNLLVHAVAVQNPDEARARIKSWRSLVRSLRLFTPSQG